MADKNLIYKVDVENLSEIDKLNTGIDKVTNTTKKGGTELSKYRRELNLAKGELLNLEEGTKEYNRALVRVSELQTKYKAMMDSSKAATRDMGEQAKLVGGAIGGIAGGFQVAAGVMGLFGAESENAQKAIQGIVGAIAVTEGIVRFADTFDSIQDLIAGFRAHSAITEMSSFDEVTKTTTQSVDSLGSSMGDLGSTMNTSANITQLNALNKVTNDLNDSINNTTKSKGGLADSIFNEVDLLTQNNEQYKNLTKEVLGLNSSLDDLTVLQQELEGDYDNQLGIYFQMEDALGDVTENTDEYTEALGLLSKQKEELANIDKNVIETQAEYEKVQDSLTVKNRERVKIEDEILQSKLNEIGVTQKQLKDLQLLEVQAKKNNRTIEEEIKLLGDKGKTLEITNNKVNDYKSKQEELSSATDKSTESQNKLNDTQKSASSGMLKNIAMMGGVLLAIGAITYAVSKLIEWMNKVPKDVEISITLLENVEEKMKGVRTDLSKIANDYSKALRDNDVAMQEKIIKYANDKYGITKKTLDNVGKDMIKNIKDGTSAWDSAFSTTLSDEAVKQYQTELIEVYREKQTELNKLIEKEEEYRKKINETVAKSVEDSKAGKGTISLDFDVSRLARQMTELKKPIKEAKEALAALTKQLPEDTYVLDIKEEKVGGLGDKVKKTYYNIKEYVQDYVGFRIKYGDLLTKKNFKWTEAEIANMTELQKKQEEIMQMRIDEGGEFLNPRFFSGNVESDIELLRYDAELYKAELKDVNLDIEKTKKIIAESASKLNPELRAKSEQDYNKLIDDTNKKLIEKQSIEFKLAELEARKTQLIQQYNNAVKIANTSTNKDEATKAANSLKGLDKEIKKVNTTITEQQDALTKVTFQIAEYNNAITKQEEYIATLEAGSKEYTDAMNVLFALQLKQRELNESLVNNDRETWQKRIEGVKQYAQAISDIYSGISAVYEGDMAMTNKKFDAEKWQIEESVDNNKEREQLLYELEMRRYDALKEDFENNKKAKEAGAWVDMLGGIVNIWSSKSVVPQPFDAILKGIQSAALLATTWGSVEQIRAQKLEKPHAPRSSGGAGSTPSISALALNPKSTELTTTEDRLNINRESNLTRNIQAEVKVSDINKVQNKVAVRDAKTSY